MRRKENIDPKYIPLFWRHVDKTPGRGPKGECWGWSGSFRNKGYGAFCWMEGDKYRQGRAHVFSFLIHGGTLGFDNPCVLHQCDTPECSNPAHLFAGTVADNNRDMCEKGRHVSGGTRLKERGEFGYLSDEYKRGVNHHAAKFENVDILSIRASDESYSSIARQFGVGVTTIHKIKTRKSWKHIK